MGRLDGKVAIVTGGSRGIGKAVCNKFAHEGARVVVAAKTARDGGTAMAMQVNVREGDAIDEMALKTIEAYGRVDILINNAGAIFIANAVPGTHPGPWSKSLFEEDKKNGE